MIETEQTVSIDVAIDAVWDYVRHIEKWASLMPGLQQYTVIDANDSRWILKVGVGGLVRIVKVFVHVDRWEGPSRVDFSYRLEGDPVSGGGNYLATRTGADTTEVAFNVRVEGRGPMAPMWEAMGGPLLPKFAKAFAAQLKSQIEAAAEAPEVQVVGIVAGRRSALARIGEWLRTLWQALFS